MMTIYTVDGVTANFWALCKLYGKKPTTVKARMRSGMTIEDALKKPIAGLRNKPMEKESIFKQNPKKDVVFIRTGSCGGYYWWRER